MIRQGYITDIDDDCWQQLQPVMGAAEKTGRRRVCDIRHVVNALAFLLATGTQWRNLPNDFPSWRSVHYYFTKWKKNKTFSHLAAILRDQTRLKEGRKAEPTAGILDAQAVDCPTSGECRGFDTAKNVKGRKRHILTDVLGLVLVMVVTSAATADRDGALLVLQSQDFPPRLKHIWADKGYRGPIVANAAKNKAVVIEIVANPSPHEFKVAQRRWVVERTHAWFSAARRLTVDREKTVESSKALLDFRLCLLYAKWSLHGIA